MARGKIVRLGKYRINFSSRGIATKNDETGVVRKYPFPWVKYQMEKEARRQEEYDPQEGAQGYDESYDEQNAGEQPYDLPYDEETGEYYEPEEEEEQPRGALYENEWLMWLLLIVLPPLGIWVLWRRNRFQITARSAISAASSIWCIVLLVWLFSGLGANGDPKAPQASPSAPPLEFADNVTATPTIEPTGTPIPDTSGVPANPVGVSATAQPDDALTGTTQPTTTTMPSMVWATPTGTYYHSRSDCDGMQNASLISLSVALTRGQTACPKCFTQDVTATASPAPTPNTTTNADGTVETIYYDTPTGKYYHILPNCGMKSSRKVTKAEAESIGQSPCPTCIGSVYWTEGGSWYHTISNCQGMKGAKMTTIAEAQKAGKTACPTCAGGTMTEGTETKGTEYYWCTDTGTYYHSKSDCTGMKGATKVTAEAAEANGKKPCPKCVGSSGAAIYYATPTGTWFHSNATCGGMKNATKVSLATATARNQTPCPTCLPGMTTVKPTTGTNNKGTATGTVTFYSTKDGKYFHTRQDCTGMKGATAVTAKEIAARNQTACPKCVGTAGTYYSTKDGKYYHSKATCTGMKGATIVTLAEIKARGQTACPTCLGGSKEQENDKGTANEGTGDYWHTANGKYYHKDKTCDGMKGATRTTAAAAEKAGQSACPKCIGSYWHTATGTYYHAKSNCTGMTGAVRTTAEAAKKLGQTACPTCLGGGSKTAAPAQPTATPKPDEGTGNYWHTATGSYYHKDKTCSGMKGATRTTAAAAEKAGQSACPDCIGSYWHTAGGQYYHVDADCDGMSGATRTTAAAAKKLGQTACPKCIGGGTKPTATPKPSEDGDKVDPDTTNVYVTIEGSYYHTKKTCGGMKNAAQTTLRWALDHNYKRCKDCNAPVAK
ncbi:MAG: hypothetical protein SOT76_12045 [Eubacteriales bacterium]|nr:hypothetical protein [Eubacteriales bacterium]